MILNVEWRNDIVADSGQRKSWGKTTERGRGGEQSEQEFAEDKEERAEAGEVEKERGVMPEDEEVKSEEEVEKERFQCSDCEKT